MRSNARWSDDRVRMRTAILTGTTTSLTFPLPESGTLIVGRSDDADLPMRDDSLSRKHVRLHLTPTSVTIEDLASKNGTRLGDRVLARGAVEPLALGTVAELGGVMLTVVATAPAPRAKKKGKDDIRHDLVATPSLEPLLALVGRVAGTELPVLLLGETGVGKDVFAERIHLASRRAAKPFVRVNTAAIAEALFESELFGHEQGAFTGAVRARSGLLEAADGGTIFLDEVGELPPSIQVKLLRVIDDRRVQRVGGTTSKRVDVRFVVATNRDLAKEVARGAFRKDLYHRLRGVLVAIPALRDRRDDVPLLAGAFLKAIAPEKKLSPDALRVLGKAPFWGNVRELKNVIERTALLAPGRTIGAGDIVWDERAATDDTDPEARRIAEALARSKGNQTAAAKLLGMSRRSLLYKIEEHGLPRPRKRTSRARTARRRRRPTRRVTRHPLRLFALVFLATSTAQAANLDTSLPRPFMMSLRGASSSEAWVTMQGRQSNKLEEGVVDLKSGCIVETMPAFSRFSQLSETAMADAATKAEIVRFVAAGRRFGRRRLGFGTIAQDNVAFSSDGKTIAVEGNEIVFRSPDGGQTFDRLDANMSRFPSATADGKWIVYERCADPARRNQSCPDASRELRIVAADDSTPARKIALGSGLLRGMDPTGQKVVVVRYDLPNEVTVMHVDPAAGTMTRAFGIPSAPLPKNRFHDIDPSRKNGSFGLFDDNEKHPISVFTVVSMTDGKIVQQFSVRNEMGTETDDEAGRLMWQTYPDDHAWARRPGGAVVDLGMGDPLGWAPGGRALVFSATYAAGRRVEEPAATLGTVACKLVRITNVP